MSTPASLIAQGYFTSDGTARVLELPVAPDYFEVVNRSTWGTAPTAVVKSWWYRGMGNGAAYTLTEGGGSALTATAIAAGGAGFTVWDWASVADGAVPAATITAITNATPPVVSHVTTPVVGNIVRLINPTGVLQLGSIDFEVTAVTAGVNFTLGYMIAPGSAGTGGNYRVIAKDYTYYPRRRYITNITAAASGVITFSVTHGYAVGQWITLNIPAAYGTMSAFNGRTVQITAINTTTNTVTVNLDTSAYAFAWPTTAVAAGGFTPAQAVPAGEVATILTQSTYNTAYNGMYLDTGVVGANTNVMDWRAFKGDLFSI